MLNLLEMVRILTTSGSQVQDLINIPECFIFLEGMGQRGHFFNFTNNIK